MTIPPTPHGAPTLGELLVVVGGEYGRWSREQPEIALDGQPVPAKRGLNRYPVAAGPHQVRVQMRVPVRGPYGLAEDVLPVLPAAGTEVYYSPPALILAGGRMGPVPQRQPWRDGLLISLGATFGLILGFGLGVLLFVVVASS